MHCMFHEDLFSMIGNNTPSQAAAAAAATTAGAAAWHHCDLPYIWWFDNQGSTVNFTHLFAIEYDVSWSGSLPRLLSSYSKETADLLCSSKLGTEKVGPTWFRSKHKNIVNARVKNTKQLRKCFVQIVRISRRLLQSASESLSNGGNWMHCEMRIPSLCASRRNTRCRANSLYKGHSQNFGTFGWTTSVSNRTLAKFERKKQDKFFHASKW